MVSLLTALIPVLVLLLKVFLKTPSDQYEAKGRELVDYFNRVHLGIDSARKTEGDTSALEDTINSQ